MASLKAAVIGLGGHGNNHLQMIADAPEMRLVGVSDLDEQRLAAAAAYEPEVAATDYREMLDRARPDVVYVVTLPGHLLPIVRECLERGIHTSVEKSPGNTSADTAAMIEAETASTRHGHRLVQPPLLPADSRRQTAGARPRRRGARRRHLQQEPKRQSGREHEPGPDATGPGLRLDPPRRPAALARGGLHGDDRRRHPYPRRDLPLQPRARAAQRRDHLCQRCAGGADVALWRWHPHPSGPSCTPKTSRPTWTSRA